MSKVECYECKHFIFTPGEPTWSEFTPGWSMSMSCDKGHWSYDANRDNGRKEFVQCFRAARTCPDAAPEDDTNDEEAAA